MSIFTAVDSYGDPSSIVRYLDRRADAASRMKHYVAAAHARHDPHGRVLDLGCGVGHDLILLNGAGLTAVGVDPSAILLAEATKRIDVTRSSLIRADGESLPFPESSFDGCRIERVLMHVVDPSVVLAEVVRCVCPSGLITVFEPDWSRFSVREDSGDVSSGWIAGQRHPDIGGDLWRLVEEAGCKVVDRVEELSIWRSLEALDEVIGLEDSVRRAVEQGRIDANEADQWVQRQRARQARSEFLAFATKVLIVATR
ncbi:MAG TPA: methyltransferase domain-containing protein [Acidimicrobiales bacterium]|nr:methyltransferase domain-containing protein [Acidimicrobiales bacterium]